MGWYQCPAYAYYSVDLQKRTSIRTVHKELVNELHLVPQERLITPSKVVAGPILESLKYAVDEPHLRKMYAKLLATTMDAKTAGEAHPSFVDIVRQLTPDEARIVALFGKHEFFPAVTIRIHETKMEPEKVLLGKHYVRADAADELVSVSYDTIILEDFSLVPYDAGCAYPEKWPTYLNNLCRLNLCEFSEKKRFRMARQHWDTLYEHPSVIAARAEKTSEKSSTGINDSVIWVTAFGKQFYQACVQPHDTTDIEATVPLDQSNGTSKPAKSRKRKTS